RRRSAGTARSGGESGRGCSSRSRSAGSAPSEERSRRRKSSITSTATPATTGGRTYARCASPVTTAARPANSRLGGGSTRTVADEGRRLCASDARRCRSGPRAVAPDAGGRVDRAGPGAVRRGPPLEPVRCRAEDAADPDSGVSESGRSRVRSARAGEPIRGVLRRRAAGEGPHGRHRARRGLVLHDRSGRDGPSGPRGSVAAVGGSGEREDRDPAPGRAPGGGGGRQNLPGGRAV